ARLDYCFDRAERIDWAVLIARTIFITTRLLGLSILTEWSVAAATNAPFSIEQRDGISWLARPNGERFFSLGVCVVNQGEPQLNSTNPGYAALQQYGSSNEWAQATLNRLKSWKFSTVGGWSDYAALKRCNDPEVAFTPMLAVGMACGVPWVDMWDSN